MCLDWILVIKSDRFYLKKGSCLGSYLYTPTVSFVSAKECFSVRGMLLILMLLVRCRWDER